MRLATTTEEVVVARTTYNVSDCCVVNKTKELCAFNGTVQKTSGQVALETVDDYSHKNLQNVSDAEQAAADAANAAARTRALDLAETHPRLRGFVGGFAVGDHAFDYRAEALPVGPDFATYFKRTAPAFRRCKNQQKRCSYGRDRIAPAGTSCPTSTAGIRAT